MNSTHTNLKLSEVGAICGNRWFKNCAAAIAMMLSIIAATVSKAAPLAYYQFENNLNDSDGIGTANNLTIQGAASPTYVTGMFGQAFSTSDTLGWGRITDVASPAPNPAADFDANFNNFSVEIWVQPNTWQDSAVRIFSGKTSASSSNRGWFFQKTTGTGAQLQFGGFTAASGGTAFTVSTTGTQVANLPTASFTHIVGAYDDANNRLAIYINGIQAAATTTSATPLTGINSNAFEVGNRGNATTATAYIGLMDDYYVASDTFTAQQIALTHGLGRLAGVSLGTGTEILDVLAAYTNQTFAEAGTGAADGTIWYYSSNVGGGNTVGTIGGTVAGGNAFIVLNADGSGVTIVPEPSALLLAGFGLAAFTALRRRRRMK